MRFAKVVATLAVCLLVTATGCRSRGITEWSCPIEPAGEGRKVEVVVGASVAYVLDGQGRLRGVSLKDGLDVWDLTGTLQFGPQVSLQLVQSGLLLVNDDSTAWLIDRKGRIARRNTVLGDANWKAAGVTGAAQYAVRTSASIVGLTARGAVAWRTAGSFEQLMLSGQSVVAASRASDQPSVVGLDLASGAERWSVASHPAILRSIAVLGDTSLILSANDVQADSIDDLAGQEWNYRTYRLRAVARDGGDLWNVELPGRYFAVDIMPAEQSQVVFVVAHGAGEPLAGSAASRKVLMCLSSNGKLLWQLDLPENAELPAVTDGTGLLFSTQAGDIMMCRPGGDLVTAVAAGAGGAPGQRLHLLSVADGRVLYTLDDRTLVCRRYGE